MRGAWLKADTKKAMRNFGCGRCRGCAFKGPARAGSDWLFYSAATVSDLLKAGWLPPVQRAEPTLGSGAKQLRQFPPEPDSSRASQPYQPSQLRCLTVREWPSSSGVNLDRRAAQADATDRGRGGRSSSVPSVDPGRSRNALGGSADWITMPLAAAANALALPLTALLLRLAVLLNLLLWAAATGGELLLRVSNSSRSYKAVLFIAFVVCQTCCRNSPRRLRQLHRRRRFPVRLLHLHHAQLPARYPARSDCIKLIRAEYPHQVVKLDFRDEFFIEDNSQCATDYLEIRDGPYGYSPQIPGLLRSRVCGRGRRGDRHWFQLGATCGFASGRTILLSTPG
uniref:CUB domain-containing protein n=1 Tax=Macrostomum lignano TaxID=282301 RepID=A0A1I8F4A2_9PLAT